MYDDDRFGELLGQDLRQHADEIDTDLVAVSLAAGRRRQTRRRTTAAAGTVLGAAVLVAGAALGPQLLHRPAEQPPVLGAPGSQAPTPLPTPSGHSGSQPPVCTSANTKVTLETDPGKAGSVYRIVVEPTNGRCTIRGFPGVAMTKSGAVIGATADYIGARGTMVVIGDGVRAESTITFTKAAYLGKRCKPTRVWQLQVYLPNERLPLALPLDEQACQNRDVHQMTVTAFRARG